MKESAIPRATFETDELAYRQAVEKLRVAQARFESLGRLGRGTDRVWSWPETAARELERRVAALTVTAPPPGIAYGLPRKTGETVAAGQVVASVADPEHLRVRARVDQPDLPRVAVGQRLIVTFDGLPDRRWRARSSPSRSGVREASGARSGEVIGEISDQAAVASPNASVNVQIVVGEKHGVPTIPRAALFRDGNRSATSAASRTAARGGGTSRSGLIGIERRRESPAACRRTTPSSCPDRRRSPTDCA